MKILVLLLTLSFVGCVGPNSNVDDAAPGTVIEVATFRLQSGVTPAAFLPLDRAVEAEHVAQQPGFLSRESGSGEDGTWVVIVHWRSLADADASMATFMEASATAPFLAKIELDTMVMQRYVRE